MATPKKQHKKRDTEQTMNRFMIATGEIVGEEGFAALTSTRLAIMLGKTTGLINYHFGSINGLIEFYINNKDYWKPFFERFMLLETATEDEVRLMFVEMMQACYDVFLKDREMQNIILRQMSKTDVLMRKISDQREADGAPLLKLAERYFEDSELNFSAVIALLLGGIYHIGLHARYNQGTVCGLDVNEERDRDVVREAIAQVINSVWLNNVTILFAVSIVPIFP